MPWILCRSALAFRQPPPLALDLEGQALDTPRGSRRKEGSRSKPPEGIPRPGRGQPDKENPEARQLNDMNGELAELAAGKSIQPTSEQGQLDRVVG